MALSSEDLRAIEQIVQQQVGKSSDELRTELRAEMRQQDEGLRTEVRAEIATVDASLARTQVKLENVTDPNIELILEIVRDTNRKLDEMRPLRFKVEEHDHRIWALEQTVKTK